MHICYTWLLERCSNLSSNGSNISKLHLWTTIFFWSSSALSISMTGLKSPKVVQYTLHGIMRRIPSFMDTSSTCYAWLCTPFKSSLASSVMTTSLWCVLPIHKLLSNYNLWWLYIEWRGLETGHLCKILHRLPAYLRVVWRSKYTVQCFHAILKHQETFVWMLMPEEKEREKQWIEDESGCKGWRDG